MGVKEQLQLNNQQLEEHRDFIPTMPTAEEARNGQYTWHKYEVLDGKKGKSVGFVVDDSEMAYPMDGIHTDGFYYILYGIPLKVVTWADGTDEDIVAMVKAADEGKINLADYWAVGQERKVTLKAIKAETVDETHASQEVTFVLMNVGGKTLVNGKECSFIVGMKNSLKEKGYMHPNSINQGGWSTSFRRPWCNSAFKNSIPSTLLPIFKEFKNRTSSGPAGATVETNDFFYLPSEFEVLGKRVNGDPTFEPTLKQFQWYKTTANRKKKLGDAGSLDFWFTNSREDTVGEAIAIDKSGLSNAVYPYERYGISPCGCI